MHGYEQGELTLHENTFAYLIGPDAFCLNWSNLTWAKMKISSIYFLKGNSQAGT